MPHTIATKRAYSERYWEKHGFEAPERDTFELLRDRVDYRYESEPPEYRATVFTADMRSLPSLLRGFKRAPKMAVTSPPYLDVTNFEEDQWLRNWFLGGPAHPTYNMVSRDNRHGTSEPYWRMIADMWRMLGAVLGERSPVVIRFGAKLGNPERMIDQLTASTAFAKRKTELVHSGFSDIKNRQTEIFRPGSKGCLIEVDCHFAVA